jgi:hypothetical protein
MPRTRRLGLPDEAQAIEAYAAHPFKEKPLHDLNATPVVGLVGLGAMGSGMAQSLRRAGHAPHVFDVRPEVAEAFARDGGTACDSLAALGAQCDIVVSVVVNAAQTESVLFGDGTTPGCARVDEARQPVRDVLHRRSELVGGAGGAAGEAGHPVPRRAHLRRRRQGRERPDDDDDRRHARRLRQGRRRARRHGRQGLPPGRPRGRGQQGEGHQPAAGRRAHRRGRRGHGAGPARRRGPGRAVRGHHATARATAGCSRTAWRTCSRATTRRCRPSTSS